MVDHEERRRAIAAAALDAVAANGLESTKLTDIGKAAGVTTGAIAHYFPDKDAVLAAALDEVATHIFLKIGMPDGPPTLEEIASSLPIDENMRKDWRVWLAYWGRAPFSPTLAAIHNQYYSEIQSAVADDLIGLSEDPHGDAAAIIAAVDGIGTRATLDPDAWSAERQRALLQRLIGPLLDTVKSNHEKEKCV